MEGGKEGMVEGKSNHWCYNYFVFLIRLRNCSPIQGQEQVNNYKGICLLACTFCGFPGVFLDVPALTAVGTRQSQEEGSLTQKEEMQHRTHSEHPSQTNTLRGLMG